MDTWHRGDWLQTYSGKRFYPLAPLAEDIDPLDIAHALSLLCRYGGHVARFYSVAQHCVLMSNAFEDRTLALWALLHDATEAYVVDVPRPLKRHLGGYREIEHGVMVAIAERFGLSMPDGADMPAPVKLADDAILLTERDALMAMPNSAWDLDGKVEPLDVEIHAWDPEYAEVRYQRRLRELLG